MGKVIDKIVGTITGYCTECQYKIPNHGPYCKHASIEDVRRGVGQAKASADHWRKRYEVLRSQVAFWQAKFHTVKHENNKLRRRLYESGYDELVRAAGAVIDNWEEGDLAGAVNALHDALKDLGYEEETAEEEAPR